MSQPRFRFLPLLLSIVFVLFVYAFAPPGDLDPTFNGVGYVQVPLGLVGDPAAAAVIQTDGRIVVVGSAFVSVPSGNDAVVVRLDPNGTLDGSFGSGGVVYLSPGGNERANAIALQSDGKIVIAGHCQIGTGRQFMVARYHPNGTLDTSFDGDGIAATDIRTSDDLANAIAIQPDGKIVVGGSSDVAGDRDFTLVRYNENGSLDTSFDGDGIFFTNLGVQDMATSLAVQLDRKIVAAGRASNSLVVLRFNPNGTPDSGFGSNGLVGLGPFVADGGGSNAVALQADGKIVVGGSTVFPFDYVVVRLNTNGSFDPSFDGDGFAVTNINPPTETRAASDDHFKGLALQSDGKIVVAGDSRNITAQWVISFARWNADGSLDTSFGYRGKIITDIPGGQDNAHGATSAPDGRVLMAGYLAGMFGIARYQGSPIAPTANISGRAVDANGSGVAGARITLLDHTGIVRTAMTNPFGHYHFVNVPTSVEYTISAVSKRTDFVEPRRTFTLYIDILGLHFVGR